MNLQWYQYTQSILPSLCITKPIEDVDDTYRLGITHIIKVV